MNAIQRKRVEILLRASYKRRMNLIKLCVTLSMVTFWVLLALLSSTVKSGNASLLPKFLWQRLGINYDP
jgi:hypothetical protein